MNAWMLAAGLAVAVGITLAVAAHAQGDADGKGLEVGAAAPAFRLNDDQGNAVALGGGAAHGWFVLAFYPKAMTGGCTKEVCSLRDSLDEIKKEGVAIYGISLDDVASQRKFVEAQHLNFPLLSDPDGSVARKFQVLPEGAAWANRTTFVVDPKGVIRHVDRSVNVLTHGADLKAVLDGLMKK